MHIATKKNHFKVVAKLIKLQFPVNKPKKNGITPVGIAAYHNNVSILKLLHTNGANINITNKNGIGPLNLAIKSSSYKSITYLLKNGAHLYYL